MGTCIGKRNLKYFLAFLFWTSLHGLATCGISATYVLGVIKDMDESELKDQFGNTQLGNLQVINVFVAMFSGSVGVTLLFFFLYALSNALQNTT